MVNLLWHAHLARDDFHGREPVPLFHFAERLEDWFVHD